MMLGKTITLNPTEGGYQKPAQGDIGGETRTRFTVNVHGKAGTITFIKATGQPYSKADKVFPCYVADMESIK